MKKDIPIIQVSQVGIAIIPETDSELWEVYLINLKDRMLRDIIVNSRGYGEVDGKKIETPTMRYYFEYLGKENAMKIELIQDDLLKVANEYWISFKIDDYLYDKKLVFVQGSISSDYFSNIPIVEKRGVIII
jgi:hypothetical protein